MTSPFTFSSLNISIATPNISAQLQIYQRFSKYIGATSNISAIFEIYRLTDKD
ncbi:hypothetical protein [Bacillus thuringiensis]|uniref:hypothetical protein n=1 Tax=Bacillus thuringiensis TaxID=1428 RepID=UPI00164235B5|nr:hypothetical protein [Bacillus thuringiensis]